jgi:hypothetical protein
MLHNPTHHQRSTLPILALYLLTLALTIIFSGCHTTHAHPAPPKPATAKAQPSPPPAPAPVSKHPSRDSEFTVYRNPDYGLSFRYPRNFDLREDFEEGALQPLEGLTGDQPGAIPVAAVEIPSDAFPNTTFRSGTLLLVVNPAVTPDTCRSFTVPPDSDQRDSTGATTVAGVPFHWWETIYFANHTDYSSRIYTAFLHSTCAEFFLQVTDSDSMVPDPAEKPADSSKILRQLEKIVTSLQLHTPAPPAEAEGSSAKAPPIINSFTVESVPHPLLQNVVRVSWNISGAAPNEAFLRVNCPGHFAPELNPLPDSSAPEAAASSVSATPTAATENATNAAANPDESPDPYSRKTTYRLESIFACNSFTPLPPQSLPSGTFRLQIEPQSADAVSFTLFVFHLPYLTRSPN